MADSPPAPSPLDGLPLDPEARECFELAAWIGALSADDALTSFTTVLIALLRAPNGLSRWWERYARAAGVDVDEIYATRGFDAAMLRSIGEKQAQQETPTGKTPWTSSAQQVIGAAEKLMAEAGSSEIGVRHVLAVYIFRVPPAHTDQMRSWAFDLPREGSAFLRQMQERYPHELDAWTKVYLGRFSAEPDLAGQDPLPAPRISSFAADRPEGKDLLDIEDDVYAFSALICSKSLEPPLAIGLFGEWGSGKSFYIQKIKAGVDWISKQARASGKMQKDIPFLKRVVQVEFNAWHYSEGNLWASLVQHILDNLAISEEERATGRDLLLQRRQHLQQQMQLEKVAREAAEVEIRAASTEVDQATAELARLRSTQQAELERLQAVLAEDVLATIEPDAKTVQEVNGLLQDLGLDAVGASTAELLAAIEGMLAALRRGSAAFANVSPGQLRRFYVAAAFLLIGPPAIALAVAWLFRSLGPSIPAAAALMAGLSSALTIGAAWLRRQTEWLNQHVAKLEELRERIEQRVAARRQEQEAEVAQLQARIQLKQQDIAAAEARQRQAAERLKALESELAGLTPEAVLADFLRERSQSQDYRQYLGLPALIQRDFKQISDLLDHELREVLAMQELQEEQREESRRINRIVLYIDDLDRCSEDQVVRVLQAVHLLLAFRIFVVVVAVDARWVSRSLARRFPGLLTQRDGEDPAGEGAPAGTATPYDYLEKIFQVPFWVQPPRTDGVRTMLRELMKDNLAEQPTPAAPRPAGEGEAAHPPEHQVFRRKAYDPHARSMEVQPQEMAFVEGLAPLIGRTPRSIKRFVNIYRLIKTSLPPEEQLVFLEQDGPARPPFQAALFLLAVATGLPHIGDQVLEQLAALREAGNPATPQPTFGHIVSSVPRADVEQQAEAAQLEAWLQETYGQDWRKENAAYLVAWVPRIGRYSYKLHRA